MCTAGRIKHHLKHELGNARSTVLFVGYQARGSLGHVIQSGISPVRIHGEWFDVRARIATIEGFSAHADRTELIDWFEDLGGNPGTTFMVHGDPESAAALASELQRREAHVLVPENGDEFDL
jgi:metallo-beta-lactamase family protein